MECVNHCGDRIWYCGYFLCTYDINTCICVQIFQEPEDLFETVSQALLNAVDRDALSGWGAIVHIM